MTISIDWQNRLVLSTVSIGDIVAHATTLRDFEESAEGILYPPIITYKVMTLGGGAFFPAVDYINGYRLSFPNAGNYTVTGNIGAAIVPAAGVFVDRTTSAAFATVAGSGGGGGGGLTPEQAAQLAALAALLPKVKQDTGLIPALI